MADSAAEADYIPPLLTVQQEDAIIHTRITNDEKALRRVTKKFHSYASVAYTPIVPLSPLASSSVDDAREAFLLELASFQLSLKKSLMVCEAEARQVEEYQRERERISNEHSRLKGQIEELKSALEQAQLERKQKIEYDVIAEKVNSLPSRDELEQSIQSLENDMAAIRAEHENQNRTLQAQKEALDGVVQNITALRLMGKQDAAEDTPVPDTQATEEDVEMDGTASVRTREESGELKEDGPSSSRHPSGRSGKTGDGDQDSEDEDTPSAKPLLNPAARAFMPSSSSRMSTPILSAARGTPTLSASKMPDDDDIEMGEIGEEPKDVKTSSRKVRAEELEEGEATDESSELSEPPDD